MLPKQPHILQNRSQRGVQLSLYEAWDKRETTFRTRYVHFEYTVMSFGLTNAPDVFQHMMNDIFRAYLDQFFVIDLDDILILSPSSVEQTQHVRLVLTKLCKYGLYAKREKCGFDRTPVEFLGYTISLEGITMDGRKVMTIQEMKPLTRVKDLQSFLGFANFYRQFIRGFSTLAQPLITLTRRDHVVHWTPE